MTKRITVVPSSALLTSVICAAEFDSASSQCAIPALSRLPQYERAAEVRSK